MKEDLTQTSFESLVRYYDELIPLSKEGKEKVMKRFHPRLFWKRQYVLQELKVAHRFYCSVGLFEDV